LSYAFIVFLSLPISEYFELFAYSPIHPDLVYRGLSSYQKSNESSDEKQDAIDIGVGPTSRHLNVCIDFIMSLILFELDCLFVIIHRNFGERKSL
jgi:hypothetical protein